MKPRTVKNIPAVTSRPTNTLSREFFERAVRFYQGQPDATPKASHIWNGLRDLLLSKLERALQTGNVAWLQDYMGHLYEHGCLAGMDHSAPGIDPNFYAQELVSLAYATGAIRVWNETQEGEPALDFTELFNAVAPLVPFYMDWPGRCGGVPGVEVSGSLVPLKVLEAAQLVVTARRLIPQQALHALEIGGGTGFNAYGFTEAYAGSHYYMVDLPVVSVIQAFLLSSALGETAVSFHGEYKNEVNICGLHWPAQHSFDLFLNRNSMPEIPKEVASNYMVHIACELKSDGVFISVNHEAGAGGQTPVSELAKAFQTTLKCTGRSPWWPVAGGWESHILETFKTV